MQIFSKLTDDKWSATTNCFNKYKQTKTPIKCISEKSMKITKTNGYSLLEMVFIFFLIKNNLLEKVKNTLFIDRKKICRSFHQRCLGLQTKLADKKSVQLKNHLVEDSTHSIIMHE